MTWATKVVGEIFPQPERFFHRGEETSSDGRYQTRTAPLKVRTANQRASGETASDPYTALVDGDDMVATDLGCRPPLAQEALPILGVYRQLRLHDLQRHRPLQPGVVGQKNQAHAALAEQAQHAVVPQSAQLVRLLLGSQELQGRGLSR